MNAVADEVIDVQIFGLYMGRLVHFEVDNGLNIKKD